MIAFYYFWKKTTHYKIWKKAYIPDIRDTPITIESINQVNTTTAASTANTSSSGSNNNSEVQ